VRRLHGAFANFYFDRTPNDLGDLIFTEIDGERFRSTWRRIVGRADLLSRLQDCSQSAHKDDPFSVPEFLQSAESRRNSAIFR
jgi:hypothetical protein